MKKLQIAIMAAALVVAVQARASFYDLSFSATDGSGVAASGTLNVVSGIATGGSLDVTGGAYPGNYTLLVDPASPGGYHVDPSSPPHASFDGLVSPGSTPFLNSYSEYGGLVWENGGDTVGFKMAFVTPDYAAQLHTLYGAPYSPNKYMLWGWQNSVPDDYAPQAFGAATLTAVPEPTTLVAGALMLLPFGASTLRIMRKKAIA